MTTTNTTDASTASEHLDKAISRYRTADEMLIRAMRAADTAGVARREIARRVSGIHSRQTTLDILGAASLAERARAVVATVTGGDNSIEVEVWQERGRRVCMTIIGAEGSTGDLNLAGALLTALSRAGIAAWDPETQSARNMQTHLGRGKFAELGERE